MTVSCQTVNVTAVGSISISSVPTGAEIWIAPHLGTYTDQGVVTNNTISNIAIGSYDVKLTLSGYQDWITTSVSVTDGVTTNLSATLISSTGSVSFTSTPSGATIYIDNVLQIGTTTPSTTITGLTPGSHTYKLTLSGYADTTGTFSITANTNTAVSVTFAGSLNISSTPSGASVYIDGSGTASGVTPLIVTGFIPGTHTYKLTNVGYTDIPTTNFTITAGQTTTISETMLTVADIRAQSIIVTPSTPCIEGTCSVGVSATWINNGGTSGTFVPNIIIDGGSFVFSTPYASQSLGAGLTTTKTFTVTGLTAAGSPHTICPDPN